MDLLGKAIEYLHAIEKGKSTEELAAFLAIGVEQIEFPNRLVNNGKRRDLKAILYGAEQGQKVLTNQSYEIQKSYEIDNTVILEVVWTGTLARPMGQSLPGEVIRAYIAIFIDFKDGKIIRQRNYDCFEPF